MDYTTLFEQQSYQDAYTAYKRVLAGKEVAWDYVILTASNQAQAAAYEAQLAYRKKKGYLPAQTKFVVLPDPKGQRVGSGGATLAALLALAQTEGEEIFSKRLFLIHSGGDSKRIPQYSACGKLFSPVPRLIFDSHRSTLFDEFMISCAGIAARMEKGMLTCSGDVLLLFNALQIDFYSCGAAALSMRESVHIGKNHGVFLRDAAGNVGAFLHKLSEEKLQRVGAVDGAGNIHIDTGAVIFSKEVLLALYGLAKEDPARFINPKARLSFYGDFLYPLATTATLEEYLLEQPEGAFCPELADCRRALWEALSSFTMKLIPLSPASFIHFGTTTELLHLMTASLEKYRFLDWKRHINANSSDPAFSASGSYISREAFVGAGAYIEDSYIGPGSVVGERSIVSGITLQAQTVPADCVLHGLKLKDGRFVARMYGVADNPKEKKLFGKEIPKALWELAIFSAKDTMEAAVAATLEGIGSFLSTGDWQCIPADDAETLSLQTSFALADVTDILPWQESLLDRVQTEKILQAIDDEMPVEDLEIYVNRPMEAHLCQAAAALLEETKEGFGKKIRIYYFLSRLFEAQKDKEKAETYAAACFETISRVILAMAKKGTRFDESLHFQKEEVITALPARVNWGGGWSDTPPYCMEHGGTVLNGAITLKGQLPIEVTVRRLKEAQFILASTDIGSYQAFTSLEALQDCKNPADPFALHKAGLLACGIIPHPEEVLNKKVTLEEICESLGGGLYINTRVLGIPKGSGLGTSSILAGACVKGLAEIFGLTLEENELYNRVLCMEQLMSTGGGWQDQVGGLAPGIKMVTSPAGLVQKIACVPVCIDAACIRELNERFCLIYTGQRRLARNLLREVVGRYVGNRSISREVLYEIQRYAVMMRFELEKGNVDGFAGLLSDHWELSKKLDEGATNLCIDQIFLTIDDLICGRMICGAGGGGFLQVVLKKGITKQMLQERLFAVFGDSGVCVWECEILG